MDLVHTTWSHLCGPLPSKLIAVGATFHDWQQARRKKDTTCLSFLHAEINRLSSRHLSDSKLEILLAAKGEFHHLLNKQELYWAQRSRVQWLL